MRARTKRQLIAVLIVAIIAAAAAWYVSTRQAVYRFATLRAIHYSPASGAPPYLTFEFTGPLIPDQVAGNTAILKKFIVDPGSPTTAAEATPFLQMLGAMPFVPLPMPSPALVTTNTLPNNVSAYASPMTITGAGEIWFTAPRRASV
jgi:hypothetical protein